VIATESAETFAPAKASVRVSSVPLRPALPVLLVVGASIVGLTAAHGGYFPTSWGLSATLLLWVAGLWLVVSGRTDAGRLDLLFLGLLVALTGWVGCSIVWSIVPAESVLELERTVVLLAGVAAVLVLARREDVPRLAGVVLAAITGVCTYSLATRLFPERLGTYDPVAGYRLSDPLGYWNTLGVFAAMGALLAVGVVADGRSRWSRAGAAGSLVVLVVTLYYTYSRGAWIALATGFAMQLAVSPRRLRTLAATAVVVAPVAIAVLLASRPYALTRVDVKLASSSAAGHRLAPELLALVAAAALLALVFDVAQGRVTVPLRVRLSVGVVLVAAVVAGVAGFVIREGGPVTLARHGWSSFNADTSGGGNNLNERLFSFSGNGRASLWRAARDEYNDHRVTGGGAGTFERTWQARRDADFKVRDAHSLYVETLAELGPFGLALLGAFLLVPVAAALAVRRDLFVPGVLGAYLAFVVHAGVDWDWELSGATLTALVIGSLAVVAARHHEPRVLTGFVRAPAIGLVAALSCAMILAFLGSGALSRAQDAVASKSYADAVDQANRARRLMPWSPWPLIARGDAELGVGDARAAKASYRHAISIDSGEWRSWLGLAFSTTGGERKRAYAHARSLYPRSAELDSAAARLKRATNG
jgi:O-Antigen ligase